MRKKTISFLSFLIGFWGFSQTEVYFNYDEAGNQRYRGPDVAGKNANKNLRNSESKLVSGTGATGIDEKAFWKQVRLYPVPVNDILTIDWTDELDDLIQSVSLFQHSSIHWKFQQQNLPNLNKQVKINMTGYEWGVYIIRFTLKDGRILSKNITKR